MDPFEYLFSLEQFGIKLGLANIRALAAALDEPQQSYRSVIVAGTNGKGSVTAMVETGLRAAGLRVARYTSPHLVRLEERFTIDGEPVSTATLGEVALRVISAVERLHASGAMMTRPTFFEVTTAVAFELFRRAGVDIAVFEVGLGGRFDATNIVQPLVAAITSIDLDHERYLGTTLREIAFEKAGVIKHGVPVVVGERKAEALEVITRICDERRARLIPARDGVEAFICMRDGQVLLDVKTEACHYGAIPLSLRGRHQAENAIVAVRVLETLAARDLPVGPEAVISGLSRTKWRGRLDLVDAGEGRQVLLDAAHNPAGATALAAYLREVYPGGLPLVFGAMRDKDATGMLAALLPCATGMVVTQPRNARASPAAGLAEQACRLTPLLPIEVRPSPEQALRLAWERAATICVTGSLFLVGEVLEALGER